MNAATATANDDLRPRPPGGLKRGALLALLVHVALVIGLALGVNWRTSEPTAVTAELWSSLPQSAAPREQEVPTPPAPPPKPKPAPKPEVQQPSPQQLRDAQIAIEKAERDKKAREDEEQRRKEEVAKREREKEKERLATDAAEAERKEKDRIAAEDRKKKAEEVRISKEREAIRQENLKRMLGQAGATGEPGATGTAAQSSGPSASYAGRIVARIRPNIVLGDDVPGNPDAVVEVTVAPTGSILSKRLVKSSGSRAWDDAVLRAIDRTGMLPADENGRVPPRIQITFRPRD